tara:strand:+ start:1771 stop:4311 length:2541 start_codon:yes stop_codon:yes gene_type:complete
MATKYRVQNSFAGGELSPKMHGRFDADLYKQGLKEMKNFVPLLQGPAKRRPGTYYAADATTNNSDESRLVPFYFGEGQSYVLEFSNGKIRFFSQNGQLLVNGGTTPYEVSSTGITAAQCLEIDFTQSADVLYIVHKDFKPKQLARTIATSGTRAADDSVWTLSEVDFLDGPWDAINTDNTKLVKVTAVSGSDYEWVHVDGVAIDTADDRFVLYGHGLMNGTKIRFPNDANSLDGTTSLTVGNLVTASSTATSESGFPSLNTDYYVINAQSSSFQIASTLGGSALEFKLSIAANAVTEWTGKLEVQKKVIKKGKVCKIEGNSNDFFDANDNERLIRVNTFAGSEAEKTKGIRWTWFKISSVDSTNRKYVEATSQGEVGLVDVNTREWRMGILGGDNKWPSAIEIHQQRLVVAASSQYPTTIWLSEAGDFLSFAPDSKIGVSTGTADSIGQTIMGEQILDNNAISLTIDSDTVDEIYWIEEGKKLAIGTSGGIFNLYGSETSYTITPTNFSLIRDTSWEAADIKPARVGNAMIYVQFNRRKLRVLTFSGEDVQYESSEISYQADELVGKEVKELVYQKQPHSLTWCRLKDGTLASLSYEDTMPVVGWGHHTIGGTQADATLGNHAKVESMAVIPHDGRDQLWLIVKRDINDSTVRYVEFLEKFYEPSETDQELAHFVDCGLYKTASSFTTAQFAHLKNESIRILGDGAVQNDVTVGTDSNGTVTIGSAVTKLVGGLPYDSHVVLLTPKQAVDGSLFVVGRDRVVKAHLSLHDSLGVKIGLSSMTTSEMEEFIFRLTADPLNTKVPLFTGTKTANIMSRSLDEESIKIVCDQPFPVTLVALVSEHEMNV